MNFAIAYWVLMLVWLAFGLWTSYPFTRNSGGTLLMFLLLLIIGWQVFGAPLHR